MTNIKTNASTSKIVGSDAPQKAPVMEFKPQVAQSPKIVEKSAQSAPNDAKSFIYFKESGNNPKAINKSSGACGIGQALPCSKLSSVCPDMSYECQDAFFTKYMQNRYGTWENAKAFWLSHKWW